MVDVKQIKTDMSNGIIICRMKWVELVDYALELEERLAAAEATIENQNGWIEGASKLAQDTVHAPQPPVDTSSLLYYSPVLETAPDLLNGYTVYPRMAVREDGKYLSASEVDDLIKQR
jgi:hypothetical protein